MKKGMRVAWLAAPFVLGLAGPARGQELASDQPRVVRLDASPQNGRTLVRIETTSGSINYTSFTKNRTTVVVDVYGMAVGDLPSDLAVGSAEVKSVRTEFTPASANTTSVARFVLERTAPGPTPIRLEGTALVLEALGAGHSPGAVRGERGRAPGAAAPAASAAASGPASRLTEIVTQSDGARLAIAIRGDGRLKYDSFTLQNPPRLVIDVHGVDNRVPRSQLSLEHAAVSRIRVGQFRNEPDKVARVVLDLGAAQDYRLIEEAGALHIGFGGPEALALLAPGTAAGDAALVVETAQGAPLAPVAATALAQAEAEPAPDPVDEEGTLMSIDLKDADIKDVLRYFSEISGLNIILDSGVSGTVTVRLIDVPWNKALDIILRTYGYGKSLDGNVLRIASVEKLTREEAAEAELKKAQLESRPLITMTRPISYGEASQIATVVQSTALSKKGSIIIDQRTNTLVITEVNLPEYLQRISDLIKTLDTPTPQVEIEARVVETTKTFARAFGLQYGFSHQFDATTGSTTDLVFPNSGLIRGDMIDSEGGFDVSGRGYAVNLPSSGANGALGFHFADIMNQFNLDLAIAALEDEGHGRVLSAPKVTTQSNIAASIVSGASIPVQTVANNTITVQYLPVNLQLQVTPQVTAEGTVVLKVVVDNSAPDFGVRVGFSGLPPINQRRAQTTVMVADGGTAVIGGVFQMSESEAQNRIPVLHKIPILGWLFKNKAMRRQNNELLIFITPKIKRAPAGTPGMASALGAPGAATN